MSEAIPFIATFLVIFRGMNASWMEHFSTMGRYRTFLLGRFIGHAEGVTRFGMPFTGGIAQWISAGRVTPASMSEVSGTEKLKQRLTGHALNSLILSKGKSIRSYYRMP
jgi:hypothetical protein